MAHIEQAALPIPPGAPIAACGAWCANCGKQQPHRIGFNGRHWVTTCAICQEVACVERHLVAAWVVLMDITGEQLPF